MRFSLVGIGYIAERHLKAIKAVGGELVSAYDVKDSVGILDKYFPDTKFFTEYQPFMDSLKSIDYFVICTPNNEHFSHCVAGMLNAKNVICEKPVCIDKFNYVELSRFNNIYQILQYRANPEVIKLKKSIKPKKKYTGNIQINSFRGDWYNKSWKGDDNKSGGLVYNIGIHIFDLLVFVFGNCKKFDIKDYNSGSITVDLTFKNAEIHCELSIDKPGVQRLLQINGTELDLKSGFEDSHTEVYKRILAKKWYSLEDTSQSFDLVYALGEKCKQNLK